jgi:hypothetical protein
MELQEFETDAEQVLDEIVDGRVDLPWLRGQLDRLTALRDQLPEDDRSTADWALEQLQDHLDADEADQSDGPPDTNAVRQAVQIRAEAEATAAPNPDGVALLEQALARLGEIADATTDDDAEAAVRHEAGLLMMRASALRESAGLPPMSFEGEQFNVQNAPDLPTPS